MNDDTWVTCPYNVAHRALKSRFQFHLTKCRTQHNSGDKKQCPYDANHIINVLEFEYHLTACESRESVLHFQSTDQDFELNLLPVPTRPLVQYHSEEDWDAEGDVASYQPLKNIADRPVFIQPTGLAPAERKNFRRNERGRHQNIENRGNTWKPLNNHANKSASFQSVLSEADDEEYVPLRKPNKIRQKTESVQSPPTLQSPPSSSSWKSCNTPTPPKASVLPKEPVRTSAWKSVDTFNQKVTAESSKTSDQTSAWKTSDAPTSDTAASSKSPPSTSAWKSVDKSNQKVIAESFKTPAKTSAWRSSNPPTSPSTSVSSKASVSTSAWKSVDKSYEKGSESPLNRSASSGKTVPYIGTVPKPKPSFSYANALQKLKNKDDELTNELSRTLESVHFDKANNLY
ncbi:glutamine and serine-rich protein 1-like [Trichogramma pretiosum]|uniref:glutamine and serine-rich protein 1-like n=1 Tax=Trichogramma pretiosum TaxID=7493 RepID=UPI0006C9B384|nr:glutamine and serine-rich protein 1-like [Trichogramma pretiosum]